MPNGGSAMADAKTSATKPAVHRRKILGEVMETRDEYWKTFLLLKYPATQAEPKKEGELKQAHRQHQRLSRSRYDLIGRRSADQSSASIDWSREGCLGRGPFRSEVSEDPNQSHDQTRATPRGRGWHCFEYCHTQPETWDPAIDSSVVPHARDCLPMQNEPYRCRPASGAPTHRLPD